MSVAGRSTGRCDGMGSPPQRCLNLYRDAQVEAWEHAVVAVSAEYDVDPDELAAGDVLLELASAYCGFDFES